jgi:hypothetical protein
MKGPCVSVRKSSLRPPKDSLLRASRHAGKTRRNWPGARGPTTCLVPPSALHLPADHQGPCPVAHLIPPPCSKSYFSPRDRDIRTEPPLRGGSVPDLAGQAGADERDLRLAVMAGQIGAYNRTPQESLGGMSPYEIINGRPPPRYEISAYPDSSYPPRCSDATVIEARFRESGPKNRHPYLRSREFRQCYVAVPNPSHHEHLRFSRSEKEAPPPAYAQCRMMANVNNDELATARVFRARSELDSSRTLVPRSQWMRDCEPRCSDEEVDRIWAKATESLVGSSTLSPLPPSPSSFTGGNTLKVTAELAHPSKPSRTEAKVAIDTQLDVTTALREYLTDVKEIIPDRVSGLGGESNFNEEGRLHVWSHGKRQKISIPALVAPRRQLPLDCVALLGVPTIAKLDVAVEQHLKLPQFVPLICHLGEKKLRE